MLICLNRTSAQKIGASIFLDNSYFFYSDQTIDKYHFYHMLPTGVGVALETKKQRLLLTYRKRILKLDPLNNGLVIHRNNKMAEIIVEQKVWDGISLGAGLGYTNAIYTFMTRPKTNPHFKYEAVVKDITGIFSVSYDYQLFKKFNLGLHSRFYQQIIQFEPKASGQMLNLSWKTSFGWHLGFRVL